MLGLGLRLLACAVTLSAGAASAAQQDPVDELAKRSGLPPAELNALLANCDANQMSMNFCALRDLIVAERDLQQAADGRSAASPSCKKAIDRRLKGWSEKRDKVCKKSAAKDYGGGSMERAAQAICETAAMRDMIKKIEAASCSG